MKLHHLAVILVACGLAVACGDARRLEAAGAVDCSTITAANTDDCVRMNQIQVLGTHNSYHVAPAPPVLEKLGERGRAVEYTHRPLAEQLSRLGIRQIELDVFADPQGDRFATPGALRMVPGLEPPGQSMGKAGFKVLHTQDIDYRTTCWTLTECLTEVREWSRANPGHLPLQIQIEVKDSIVVDTPGITFVKPLPIRLPELLALDAEIRRVFESDHLITPDLIRGSRPTLAGTIQQNGWPLLREARGRILFALDNTDQHRTDYLEDSPSLEGRVMFVSSDAPEPSAAFIKMNESVGPEEERIRQRVHAGFVVRTRADVPTVEARSGDTTRRDSAFRSGAQYVSTDYPEPSPFGSGYIARLPGTEPLTARCNPVNAPAGCRNEWLEPALTRRR